MARGTQHRKRRTGPNARKPAAAAAVAAPASGKGRKRKQAQWEEQLFFQRLRVHAKWAFVLLALVFGLGFVFLGIGSGSNGITDALQNAFNFGRSSGGASISSLERKAEKHSLDAQAWRDLATAYETKQRTDDAIRALSQYTSLRPKDTGALAELASQYGQQANRYAQEYQDVQAEMVSQVPPAALFAPPASTPFGKAFSDPKALQDPISTLLQQQLQTKQQTALSNYQTAQANAEKTFKQIVELTPNDANAQLQLAQAAESASDPKVALKAYEKFLKIAPQDPLAPQIRRQVTQLKKQLAPATPSTSSSK
ncbi:MAG TPA: tetratricopeptide repeat protein [Gaiellaceae bacterium]|nr:tetratricopeptide repeat protein [Gaiellaceae bacterium]